MTTEVIGAILLGLTGLLTALGKIAADSDRRRNQATREESERIARRDRTQNETSDWLRAQVTALIADERIARQKERDDCTARIDALQATADDRGVTIARLETEIAELRERLDGVPELVEALAMMIAKVDPNRTPTPAELSAMHGKLRELGASTRIANHVFLHKAQP